MKTTTRTPGRSEAGYMAALIGALCIPTSLSATSWRTRCRRKPRPSTTCLQRTRPTSPRALIQPCVLRCPCLSNGGGKARRMDRSVSPHPEGTAKSKSLGGRSAIWRNLPQGNVGSKDAELLQRDHEGLLGRKAHASTGPDARRCHPLDRDMDRYQPPGAVTQSDGRNLHRAGIPRMAAGIVRFRISTTAALTKIWCGRSFRMSGPPARPNAARRAELPLCRRPVCGLPNSTLRRGRDGTRW